MRARTVVALAVAGLALAGCADGGQATVDTAQGQCMTQATQDAADTTGQPSSDFTSDPILIETCEAFVHNAVTIPAETGGTPDVEEPARVAACVGSAAEVAYRDRESPDLWSPYSPDMSYPEVFQLAWGQSSC